MRPLPAHIERAVLVTLRGRQEMLMRVFMDWSTFRSGSILAMRNGGLIAPLSALRTSRMTERLRSRFRDPFPGRGEYLSAMGAHQRRRRVALAGAAIFIVALGVRVLHWRDIRSEQLTGESIVTTLVDHYQREAFRIARESRILIPEEPFDTSDGRMIMHPPGYSILLALIYGTQGPADRSYWTLRLVHIICDAAAALLIFLIASQLLPLAPATVAGILAALSPHFAYYSLWLTPDSIAVLPILASIWLLTRATLRPRLLTIAGAGVMIGLSCWLRSNALLLAPFLATATLPLFKSEARLRYWLGFVGSAVVVIAPITIRNWVVYRHFIPLSLGSGITLAEGIADYDKEGRFDMPADDSAAGRQEAQAYERPDYEANLFTPDGIERERNRNARAVAVIRSNPGWFLKAMFRRMAFMLRYNDFHRQDWTFHTTIAPPLSRDPGYGGQPDVPDTATPSWSSSPLEIAAAAQVESPEAVVTVQGNGDFIEVLADTASQKPLASLGPVPVNPGRDYILTFPTMVEGGPMRIKVKAADPRITLALRDVEETIRSKRSKKKTAALDEFTPSAEEPAKIIEVPFASGKRTEVHFVFSGGGDAAAPSKWLLGRVALFEIGPTPYEWTRLPRAVVQGLQKNIFKTDRLLPLIGIGLFLVALARRGRVLVLLGAVPAYYLFAQSVFHTEYRYILAIHYFLFVFAAVALFGASTAIRLAARRVMGDG